MRVYVERNYGADADGNRGHRVEEAYLDDDDYDIVVDKLYDDFIINYSDGMCDIELDGYNFEVNIVDYFKGLYEKAMSDPKVLNDPELLEWLKEDVEPYI